MLHIVFGINCFFLYLSLIKLCYLGHLNLITKFLEKYF